MLGWKLIYVSKRGHGCGDDNICHWPGHETFNKQSNSYTDISHTTFVLTHHITPVHFGLEAPDYTWKRGLYGKWQIFHAAQNLLSHQIMSKDYILHSFRESSTMCDYIFCMLIQNNAYEFIRVYGNNSIERVKTTNGERKVQGCLVKTIWDVKIRQIAIRYYHITIY